MIYIILVSSLIIISLSVLALFWILNYFTKNNKINTATFFSFVVDVELRRIRIADLASMKRTKKIFNWSNIENGQWITFKNFADHFTPDSSKKILSALESTKNIEIPVQILETKNSSVKKMNLFLNIILENGSFMILKNYILPKEIPIKSSGIKFKPLKKLQGKNTNNIVFYAMLLKDPKEKQTFVDNIYKVYPSFLQFFHGIYEYENYVVFAFKREDKRWFFDKEKKWNTILDNPKINNQFASMVKIEQKNIKEKEQLEEFKSRLEFSNYKSLKNKKTFYFKENQQDTLAELKAFEQGREFFQKQINLQKINLIKYPISKNGVVVRNFAYVGVKIKQYDNEIKKLAYIPKYKIALNDLYLKKTLLSPINKKIIDVERKNWKFILEHKTLFIKNHSVLNFAYDDENLTIIEKYAEEGFLFSIEIQKTDDEIFEKINNTNLFAIIVGQKLASNIDDSKNALWLSYLKEIAISKNIKLFFRNPLEKVENKIIKQIGLEFSFRD